MLILESEYKSFQALEGNAFNSEGNLSLGE